MAKSVTTLDDSPVAAVASADAPTAEAAVLIKHKTNLSGKRKILTIHSSGEAGGNNAVFIGLEGVGYQVPRGKPWNVPAELVENLNNAQQTFYERGDDGAPIERTSPRFAFSAIDAPDADPSA